MASTGGLDGAEVNVDQLISLRYRGAKLLFRPQRAKQNMAGPSQSLVRGRGMEYAESRAYLPGDDIPPALDLFGTKAIERQWVSLQSLKVLDDHDDDGEKLTIGIEDTKPTFISGFIVRQLVKEGIIEIGREC